MSEADYKHLKKTGEIRGTSETFVSTASPYAKKFDGVTVAIETKPGTKADMIRAGVRHDGATTAARFGKHPLGIRGWATGSRPFIKVERGVLNFGLGRGKALADFNSRILSVRLLK